MRGIFLTPLAKDSAIWNDNQDETMAIAVVAKKRILTRECQRNTRLPGTRHIDRPSIKTLDPGQFLLAAAISGIVAPADKTRTPPVLWL